MREHTPLELAAAKLIALIRFAEQIEFSSHQLLQFGSSLCTSIGMDQRAGDTIRGIVLTLMTALCLPAFAQDQGESALLFAGGGTLATITYAAAHCVGSTSTATASCALAASGAVGDLLVLASKSSTVVNTATAAVSFSGTASCSSPTQVIAPQWQPNGSGHFSAVLFACIITTAGATTPAVTWTGGDGSFTDIVAGTYHTTASWKSTFVDKSASNIVVTASTGCPTGTTAATTNANDLIVATCNNFNVAETWGTLAGFTNRAAFAQYNRMV